VTTEYLEKVQPHFQMIQLAEHRIKCQAFVNTIFLYDLSVLESTNSDKIQKLAIIPNVGIIKKKVFIKISR
jgi:hypothetical protein